MLWPALLYSNTPQCSVLQTNIMELKLLITLIFATLAAAVSVTVAPAEDANNDLSNTNTPQARWRKYRRPY